MLARSRSKTDDQVGADAISCDRFHSLGRTPNPRICPSRGARSPLVGSYAGPRADCLNVKSKEERVVYKKLNSTRR